MAGGTSTEFLNVTFIKTAQIHICLALSNFLPNTTITTMNDQAQEDAPGLYPALATHASIPELEVPIVDKLEDMARQKYLYGRSRWVCAVHFIWETLSHLSAIFSFLRWLVGPLLGPTANPIVCAVNNSTPSGFCAAPLDKLYIYS